MRASNPSWTVCRGRGGGAPPPGRRRRCPPAGGVTADASRRPPSAARTAKAYGRPPPPALPVTGEGRGLPNGKTPPPPCGCQIPCRRNRRRDCVKYSNKRGVAAHACAGPRRFGRRNRRLVCRARRRRLGRSRVWKGGAVPWTRGDTRPCCQRRPGTPPPPHLPPLQRLEPCTATPAASGPPRASLGRRAPALPRQPPAPFLRHGNGVTPQPRRRRSRQAHSGRLPYYLIAVADFALRCCDTRQAAARTPPPG